MPIGNPIKARLDALLAAYEDPSATLSDVLVAAETRAFINLSAKLKPIAVIDNQKRS